MSDTNLPQITEIYKGRLIEVYCTDEEWHASYIEPNGQKISEGYEYNTAEKCLETTRRAITWEIEQDEITGQFLELIDQFKAKGYTQSGIMHGLSEALADTLDESVWKSQVIQALEKAAVAALLPGRLAP